MKDATKLFLDYVNNYDMSNKDVRRKIDHTFRVAIYSKLLASHINLDEKEVQRAYDIGILHDIGRFEQISKYNTFNDAISIDHGYLGYSILKDLEYNDPIALNAVRMHNAYKIPEQYNNNTMLKLHCEIIRDADKLDNLSIKYKTNLSNKTINCKLIKYFQNHQLVPNEEINDDIDASLRELSFIFDMNFEESLILIKNKNVIEEKIDNIYYQTKDKNIYVVRYFINEYINQRIGEKENGRIRQKI